MKKLCECGCGKEVNNRFISGHNSHSQNQEIKDKISKTLMGHKLSQETKDKKSISMKKFYKEHPEFIFKCWNKGLTKETNEKLKNIYEDEERNKKISIKKIGIKQTKEHTEKCRLANLGRISPSKGKTNIELYGKEKANKMKQFQREKMAKQIMPFKDTKIEVKLQNFLKELNIPFIKHKPIMNIKHCYQCDIYIPKENMIIEADGDYWHKYPEGRKIDHIRNNEMKEKGYKVLRFWEHQIKDMNSTIFNEVLNYNLLGVTQ